MNDDNESHSSGDQRHFNAVDSGEFARFSERLGRCETCKKEVIL